MRFPSKKTRDDSKAEPYQIDFWHPKKLSSNILEFKIRDKKKVPVGFAVASAVDSFAILGTTLNQATESDGFKALQSDLKRFCEVYYHKASDKTTES